MMDHAGQFHVLWAQETKTGMCNCYLKEETKTVICMLYCFNIYLQIITHNCVYQITNNYKIANWLTLSNC